SGARGDQHDGGGPQHTAHGSGPQGSHGEVVEVGDRVGLGPQADLAGLGEGLVLGIDDLLAVPVDLEVVPAGLGAQLVPGAAADGPVPACELAALALHHVIQAHVVLQGVGARDVVVVLVPVAKDQTAGLVHLAGDRLAADL